MSQGSDRWARAVLALRCLALDPAGLGGIVIRARVGPARAAAINLLTGFPLPVARLTPSVGDDQLFGGVDIAATLAAGKLVETTGLLSRPVAVLLAMAERCDAGFAGRLAQHLDGAQDGCLILLDEGATPEERVPTSLTDRVAFFLDLDGLSLHDLDLPSLHGDPIDPNCVEAPPTAVADLTALALRFGIDSLRAPLLALRAARAHAALHGRSTVTADDITAAAALVYPSRATLLPEEPRDEDLAQEQEHPDNTEAPTDNPDPSDELLINAEMLVEAVRAQLPAGLLDQIKPRQTQAGHGAGTGDRRAGNRRGRPLPPRPGRLDGRARVDIVATLRAAAPWQPLRRRARPDAPGVLIRASDIRVRRFEERSDRLLIFAVDASGSAAISRLNEAKGAVELLLGEAYARRDHVALIAFRGAGADLLLPPTRSLVQTKRRLAALPGGGGTPLAAGLQEAGTLATQSRDKGLTPTIVVMTDGRANVALDGAPDRARAAEDSRRLAGHLRVKGIPGLMIDMSNRPQPSLRELAGVLDAPYVPLPRADARRVSNAVNAALEPG